MIDPTSMMFASLARSSPWRWSTLRFVLFDRVRGDRTPVRAFLRRPDALRVERLDGGVLQREAGGGAGHWPPSTAGVVLDADGFVARRPDRWQGQPLDDVMYQTYRWVAMLDPVELADGRGDDLETAPPAPVTIEALTAVEHHGRAAWEALLRPTETYDPRCSCCPLLFSAQSDRADGGESILSRQPDLRFPDAHRVRLDVGTGVCVQTEEIGGSHAGDGHELCIEAVNGPMPDPLFGR